MEEMMRSISDVLRGVDKAIPEEFVEASKCLFVTGVLMRVANYCATDLKQSTWKRTSLELLHCSELCRT